MLADPTAQVANFAAAFAALYAAHQVADHWVQTQHQADTKGQPGWRGRLSCAAHVGTYTLTAAVALALLAAVTGLPLDPWKVAAGLAVSAISHYIADRRGPLRRLAELTGSARFYALGIPRPDRDDNPSLGTGAYALDQSWHVGWLFVAALFIA
jgi:hypothetical protein